MLNNVGKLDRVLRILVGLGLLSLVFILDGPGRWWGLIGILPLATGLLGGCPAYTLLGINTCPAPGKRR